jgi:hypothetical protein
MMIAGADIMVIDIAAAVGRDAIIRAPADIIDADGGRLIIAAIIAVASSIGDIAGAEQAQK